MRSTVKGIDLPLGEGLLSKRNCLSLKGRQKMVDLLSSKSVPIYSANNVLSMTC